MIILRFLKQQNAGFLFDLLSNLDKKHPLFVSSDKSHNESVLYDAIIEWLYKNSKTDFNMDKKVLTENCFRITAKRLNLELLEGGLFDEREMIEAVIGNLNQKLDEKLKITPDKKKLKMLNTLRKEIKKNLSKTRVSNWAVAGTGSGAALTTGEAAGFALFTGATSALHAIGSIIGVTFSFGTYTALTTTLGVIFGPVGFVGLAAVVLSGIARSIYMGRKDAVQSFIVILCLLYRLKRQSEEIKEKSETSKKLIKKAHELINEIESVKWLDDIQTPGLTDRITSIVRPSAEEIEDPAAKLHILNSKVKKLSKLTTIFDDFAREIYIESLVPESEHSRTWNKFFEIRSKLRDLNNLIDHKQKSLMRASSNKDGIETPPSGSGPPSGHGKSDDKPRYDQNRWSELGFIPSSKIMQEILNNQIIRFLNDIPTVNINLIGTSGCLKWEIAREIHREGPYSDGDFKDINCANLTQKKIDKKLAPHDVKWMTRKSAGRTILIRGLDQAEEIVIGKLIDFYMYRTGYPLDEESNTNGEMTIVLSKRELETLNDNLHYLKNIISLTKLRIPAFYERQEDIAPQAMFYLKDRAQKVNKNIEGIRIDKLRKILVPHFKNKSIRELRNLIDNFVKLSGKKVTPQELEIYVNREFIALREKSEIHIRLNTSQTSGKKHMNEVSIKLSNKDPAVSGYLDDQHFYYLYFLCLERLTGKEERWMPIKEKIKKKDINYFQKSLKVKKVIDYRWTTDDRDSKSSAKSRINSQLVEIIIKEGDYFTLKPEFVGKELLILPES